MEKHFLNIFAVILLGVYYEINIEKRLVDISEELYCKILTDTRGLELISAEIFRSIADHFKWRYRVRIFL